MLSAACLFNSELHGSVSFKECIHFSIHFSIHFCIDTNTFEHGTIKHVDPADSFKLSLMCFKT